MAYFPNIIGQEHAKRILTTLYHKKHFPPLLFVGPKGVGKRTTAINFAQIINCPVEADIALNTCPRCQQIKSLIHPDIKILFPLATGLSNDADESEVLKEIGKNISSYVLGQTRPTLPATYLIPIRAIRWINQEMAYRPLINKYKIIIVIDADRMNQESANAFLKTLEEPQAQTLFILTTSRVSAILSTIRSRCQIIRFTSIPSELIINFLMQSKHISEPEAKLASIFAEGSLRKALAYIDNKDALLPSYDLLKFLTKTKCLYLMH